MSRRSAFAEETSNSQGALPGMTALFPGGERPRTEETIRALKDIGVKDLRVAISLKGESSPEGRQWNEWLLRELSGDSNLVPYLTWNMNNPMEVSGLLKDFLLRNGQRLSWIELLVDRRSLLDSEDEGEGRNLWRDTTHETIEDAHSLGIRVALRGFGPGDLDRLDCACQKGILSSCDAVSLDWSPEGRQEEPGAFLATARSVLRRHHMAAPLWMTITGPQKPYAHLDQIRHYLGMMDLPANKIFWGALSDLPEEEQAAAPPFFPRHSGLVHSDGCPRLLYRLLREGGRKALEGVVKSNRRNRSTAIPSALITGGAGFIGTNLAHRLASEGRRVIVYDSLARPGVEENLNWLCARHGHLVQVETADMEDEVALRRVARESDQAFHLAAQVAVTTSVLDPLGDFTVNARGTLNLLEALRACPTPPSLVFTSTNKVYGKLRDLDFAEEGTCFSPVDEAVARYGIHEETPLDLYSPYGCSKGGADQYVLDYARIYNLPTVVFRMSCIYGPHQRGTEDQGWVAHFLIRALRGEPITIYGNGKQVRDILFIDDLVEAFLRAQASIDSLQGQAFNIGGGTENAISLLDLLDKIESLEGRKPTLAFGPWRPGDQPWYVSDVRRFQRATGWTPAVGIADGVGQLHRWLKEVHAPARRSPSLPSSPEFAAL